MAADVLLSEGLLKLSALMLLATEIFYRSRQNASGSEFYSSLPIAVGPVVLFESIFFPNRAAIMKGPFIQACKGTCPP